MEAGARSGDTLGALERCGLAARPQQRGLSHGRHGTPKVADERGRQHGGYIPKCRARGGFPAMGGLKGDGGCRPGDGWRWQRSRLCRAEDRSPCAALGCEAGGASRKQGCRPVRMTLQARARRDGDGRDLATFFGALAKAQLLSPPNSPRMCHSSRHPLSRRSQALLRPVLPQCSPWPRACRQYYPSSIFVPARLSRPT